MAESGDAQPSAAEAARWLANEEDLAVAQRLVKTDSPVRWAACFHGQQAAEKAIKSLLVLAGVDFPCSHALDGLVALLPEDMRSHFEDDALVVLQPWPTAGRYPEDIGEPDAATTPGSSSWPPRWSRPLDRSTYRRLSPGTTTVAVDTCARPRDARGS